MKEERKFCDTTIHLDNDLRGGGVVLGGGVAAAIVDGALDRQDDQVSISSLPPASPTNGLC